MTPSPSARRYSAAKLKAMRQQLEQAQKSAEERLTAWDIENEKRHDADERASHAEAQVEGLQRMLDEFGQWLAGTALGGQKRPTISEVLAELQRRRSLGDQAHAGKE